MAQADQCPSPAWQGAQALFPFKDIHLPGYLPCASFFSACAVISL